MSETPTNGRSTHSGDANRSRWRPSAVHYLILVFALAAAPPTVTLGVFATRAAATREQSRFDLEAKLRAASIAKGLRAVLSGKSEILAVTAGTLNQTPEPDLALMQSLVDAQMASTRSFEGLYIANADGISMVFAPAVRSDGSRTQTGIDYSDRSYFVEARARNGPSYSEVLFGRQTKIPTIALGYPFYRHQQPHTSEHLAGVVGAVMRVDELSSFVTQTASPWLRTLVMDGNGRVVVDSDQRLQTLDSVPPDSAYKDTCKVQHARGLDELGTPIRVACKQLSLGSQRWTIWTSTTEEYLQTEASRAARSTIGVVAVTALILIAVSFMLFLRTRRWISTLTGMAKRVADGDLSVRPDTTDKYAPRELALLAATATKTLDQLESAAQRNTQLVNDLRAVNSQLEPLANAWMHIGDAIEVLRPSGTVLFVNPSYCKLFKVTPQDVEGQRSRLLDSGQDKIFPAPGATETPLQAVAAGRLWTAEVRSDVDGMERIQGVTASPVLDKDGLLSMVIVIRRDETAVRMAQQEDAHRQRLASVGTLAAGFAHEINNPLTFVLNNIELLREALEQGETDSDRTDEILSLADEAQEGATRIARIVRSLLRMSRRDGAEPRPVDFADLDLAQVAQTAARLSRTHLPTTAKLVIDASDALPARGVEAELVQVVLNLMLNAYDAVRGQDAPQVSVLGGRTVVNGVPEVFIDVEDNGPGMSPDVVAQIFDPFFTTKGPSKGTGLGLSVSRGIIEAQGGRLEVCTEVGKGSLFRVSMASTAQPARTHRPPTREPEGQQERPAVLVVDDEQRVARGVARVLGSECDVTLASSGHDALNRLESGAHFDVIVTDLMMPEMSGLELYRAIESRFPGMKDRLMFITGCEQTSPEVLQLRATGRPVHLKPFQSSSLRTSVRELSRITHPPVSRDA